MNLTPTTTVISPRSDVFPGFKTTQTSCVIFCEAENQLLLMNSDDESLHNWGLPAATLTPDEVLAAAEKPSEALAAVALRILANMPVFEEYQSRLVGKGPRFARIAGVDSVIHFFTLRLDAKPAVSDSYRWVSIYALNVLDQIEQREDPVEGRAAAFDVIYQDRFWKNVPAADKTHASTQLVFIKNGHRLVFDCNRKFVITLIGTVYSGKTTQADLLKTYYEGIHEISEYHCYTSEPDDSRLKKDADAFKKVHPGRLPSDLRIGMLRNNLSKSEFQTGFILKGYPASQEESSFLFESHIAKCDCFIPIVLDLPDDQVKVRLNSMRSYIESMPDSEDKKKYLREIKAVIKNIDQLLANYNCNKDDIARSLQERGSILKLKIDADTTVETIFSRINLEIQSRLDALAAQELAKAAKRLDAQEPAPANLRIGLIALLACTIVAGIIAGKVLRKNQ